MNQHCPTRQAISGAVLFDSVDDFFNALFPNRDCDAHVVAYRRHKHLAESEAHAAAWDALCKAKVAQYGSYTAWLRAEPAKTGVR